MACRYWNTLVRMRTHVSLVSTNGCAYIRFKDEEFCSNQPIVHEGFYKRLKPLLGGMMRRRYKPTRDFLLSN
jgi:hypothetical protein